MNDIVIIDYGMSNLGSIRRSVEECGGNAVVSDNPDSLKTASKIILPGVGSFNDGMRNLNDGGWVEVIRNEVLGNKIPILGICLGMQLLADKGTEGGDVSGLGLIPGKVVKLKPLKNEERLPHIGWNEVNIVRDNILFNDIETGKDFYFVHTYHFHVQSKESVIGMTSYCGKFVSAVNIDNIYGTQFHPEKSVPSGFQILRNFINI